MDVAKKDKSQLAIVSQRIFDDQMLNSDAAILTIMQEPLLDCIVRESPNKDIATFLGKPNGPSVCDPLEMKSSFPDIVKQSLDKDEFDKPYCANKNLEHEIENVSPDAPERNRNSSTAQHQNTVATSRQEWNPEETISKGIVPTRSNSVLTFQVANLQDDIDKLKEANRYLSAYKHIFNVYETKNAQLGKERLDLKQTVIDMKEVIKTLEQDNKRQQSRIMDLQYHNITLMARMDFMAAGDTLKKQLEKLREEHSLLQGKHQAEVDQKNTSINRCLEMDYVICKKEEEICGLRHAIKKLESEMKTAISDLQQKKEIAEKQWHALQEKLQQETNARVAEKEQFDSKVSWLLSELNICKSNFENERAEAENLKQHRDMAMEENLLLRQKDAASKALSHQMQLEIDTWKQQFDKVMRTQGEQEYAHSQTVLALKSEVRAVKEALKKKEEEMQWKMQMVGRFLLDMKSMHSDLSMRVPPYEADCFNSTCVQRATQLLSKINNLLALTEGILVCQDTDGFASIQHPNESSNNERINELKEKIKSLNTKKEMLATELQERRLHLSNLRGFVHEKGCTEVFTEIKKLEGIVDAKLEEGANPAAKNVKLLTDMNNLMWKVASLEEIVQCADQRLEMYSSQISDLEKRNQYLEGLIMKFRKKYRKERQKIVTKQLTSTILLQNNELQERDIGDVDDHTGDAN